MDDQITKAGHIQHRRQEVLRQHALFGQNPKDVLIVIGVTESAYADQTSAYIQANLDSYLQRAFYSSFEPHTLHVLLE